MTRSPVNIWVKASATSFWMTANTGCFAWKITSNKWPLLFSFQICDSNEQERGSLLWRQCYLHLNTGKSCLSLGLRSGRRRSRELITEGDLFSFIWGASQGALRKGERSANACQVVKMSVSFPKASVLLEGVDAASGCWQNHSGSRALTFTLADQCLLQWWGCFSSWKGAAFTAQKVRLFPQIPAGSPRAIYLLKWWRALPLSPWDSVFHILSFKSGKGSVLFGFFFFFFLAESTWPELWSLQTWSRVRPVAVVTFRGFWGNISWSLARMFLFVAVVQPLSRVWCFATLWPAARQASLSITSSWSLLKLMSIELVMPSSHLILCRPLLLLPSILYEI